MKEMFSRKKVHTSFWEVGFGPTKKKNNHSILSMQIYSIQSDLKEIFLLKVENLYQNIVF